ncbi:alpha/beta-hydrolase [Gonapodya prolifera JEL478]|uniref:Alpha/beta-hydrolase n=1 Tax=Gonapodya prolifera (strain JEL478) TaxID=1344416 RepID=A0A139A2P9_GONPJ|nr:alpha/beta-hydrolase [Gonapodya prolifera JEL478]|eukprot:KXS10623.1 alpha/beta-hydrolase [Gonapodya prolifera JEL478]
MAWYLDNCSSFDIMVPLMLEIARENHPGISWDIVCLDAAGHGRSDYEPSGNYLLHRHVHDVFKVVQRLNFTRPHLLGHSMGASILSVLSGTFPSLPASLTFLDNYGPLALPDPDVPSNLRSYIEAHERASRKARFPTVDHAITVRSDAKALISVSPDAARILCERGLVEVRDDETGATTYSWSSDAKLMVPHAVYLCSTEAATESFLKAIQCPVRMIAGTESFYRSEQRRERVEGRIKLLAQSLGPAKFQHHLIDGTHHLHLEGTDSPRRTSVEYNALRHYGGPKCELEEYERTERKTWLRVLMRGRIQFESKREGKRCKGRGATLFAPIKTNQFL